MVVGALGPTKPEFGRIINALRSLINLSHRPSQEEPEVPAKDGTDLGDRFRHVHVIVRAANPVFDDFTGYKRSPMVDERLVLCRPVGASIARKISASP